MFVDKPPAWTKQAWSTNGLKLILVMVGEGDQLNKVMEMETICAQRLHFCK
jgi:hypothetical protein